MIRVGSTQNAGWCTYEATLAGAPDVEIMCGGINSKGPSYAAVWRQGHLLHFGFEDDPSTLNDFGRGLLVNAIAYVARFRDDRPIGLTTSSSKPGWLRTRAVVDGVLRSESARKHAASCLDASLFGDTAGDAAAQRYRELRPFLYPGTENRLGLDRDAQALGVPYDEIGFLDRAVARLAGGSADERAAAARLLARYVGREAGDWPAWLQANRDYLFFCEDAGFRWLVDPLAKQRGVPSRELRGIKRATPFS